MYTLSLRHYYMTSETRFFTFPFSLLPSTIRTSFFFTFRFGGCGGRHCQGLAKVENKETGGDGAKLLENPHGSRSSLVSFFLSCPVETSCFTVERIAHNTTHVDTHTHTHKCTIHIQNPVHVQQMYLSTFFPIGPLRYISFRCVTQRRHPTVTFFSSTIRIRQSDSSLQKE